MKIHLLLAVLLVGLTTMGFDCVNDPIYVALNIDPIQGCYTVDPGNGNFNGTTTVNIKNLVPSDFRDKLRVLRIYDVRVCVTGPYPMGDVSGNAFVRLDSGPELHVLQFSGPYSAFANGVSILNSGGLVTFGTGFTQFINGISNINNLPTQAVLRGTGNGPAPQQQFSVCITLLLQAEASAL